MASQNASAPDSSTSQERKIVVYTSNGCQKCVLLKSYLKTENTSFEERSLEDVDTMTELVMRDIVVLSAPVLEVDSLVYSETEFFEGNSLSVSRLHEILGGNGNGGRC